MKAVKILLKVIAWLLVSIIVLVVGVFTAARFHDGPVGPLAGGSFTTGSPHTGHEPDWSFVRDISEVQFQSLNPERSRTAWIVEVDGRIFIPSGYMTTTLGKIWKHWPYEAEKDGRVLLRVDGTIYERHLDRIQEGEILKPILAELGRKYIGGNVPMQAVTSGNLWIFEASAPRGQPPP